MADMTTTEAFAVAPASTEKTNLISAFDTLLTRITEAATAGAFSTDVRDQHRSAAVDLAEQIASDMTDHS